MRFNTNADRIYRINVEQDLTLENRCKGNLILIVPVAFLLFRYLSRLAVSSNFWNRRGSVLLGTKMFLA